MPADVNTFRDHQILEYEIPKGWRYRAAECLRSGFGRRARAQDRVVDGPFRQSTFQQWFDDETFRGLARIRGMECRAPERYAEAFFARKVALI